MIGKEISDAIRRPRIFAGILIVGAGLFEAAAILILWLASETNLASWLLIGIIVAFPLLLSSLAAIATGAFVFARHVLRDLFSIGKWSS